MAMQLRYKGEFLSRANVVWRVEILQEKSAPFTKVGELTFEAEEPLVIEWAERGKEEVIQGSTATLQVESPGDRTYEDLYTIEVGRIRMDVYRNNTMYWSGTLDSEFYEEPYERAANYPVSLIFSDFGILDRKKIALQGMITISDLVTHCLSATGVNFIGFSQGCISTSIEAGSDMSLGKLKVRCDNFYDEDGEALTLREVLEGVLQPLALRIIQRAGNIYVYDLNALYHKGTVRQIAWDGNSSTMGVDRVYNNAKITWNAYAQSGNLAPQECWVLPTDPNRVSLNSHAGGQWNGSDYYSYHYSTDLFDWIDSTDSGFTIWVSRTGKNAQLLDDRLHFFKIIPQNDGSESEGIAIVFYSVEASKIGSGGGYKARYSKDAKGMNPRDLAGTAASVDLALFKSSEVWIPPTEHAENLLLKISINLLLDPRFNPFEMATNLMGGVSQEDWQKLWKSVGNYVYVPVTVKFQPDGSSQVYCWSNRGVVMRDKSVPVKSLSDTYGVWELMTNGSTPDTWGYLCYYDPGDRIENCGVANGWRKNRPAINPHTGQISTALEKAEDGQYIPYPDFGSGGKLWIEVMGHGWMISDGNVNLSSTEIINPGDLWGAEFKGCRMDWILMQLPEIEIVNSTQFGQTISTEDVEYSAEINSAAKESIELDTICGSSENGIPTARGAYFNVSTGKQITKLSRAGRTSQIEDLLIGTLYSQFAQRRTKLSGEAVIQTDGIGVYTEQNQIGKRFLLSGDIQNVIADTSEITIIELRPDEYAKE